MTDTSPPSVSRWRNPTFVATFAVGAVVWLAFFGWVAWRYFPVMMDWIERQHALLQEVLGGLLVIAWALFLGVGAGAAVVLADRAAGTRHLPAADARTHGQYAAWRRPDRS
jgi:hypothetical protein